MLRMSRTMVLAAALFLLLGCSNSRPAEAASPSATAPATTSAATNDSANPAPAAPTINSQRTWSYVKDFVAIGSRKPGSPGHQKAIDFIHARLKQTGVEVEDDKFTANTSRGAFQLDNVIAKIPGTKDGIIVLASHYETNFWLPDQFVGANDGGSTTGLLLELANDLKPKAGGKRDGYSVWLVFDDGEESFQSEWNDNDALWGTRHLAQKWQQDGTLKKIKGLFVLDMIGDKDLDIQRDTNSTGWLEDIVYQAASKLGYQSHFFATQTAVDDDHMPFQKLGVPVADIIDINYGYNNAFHHTLEDTIDKLSPKSLEIAGNTVLQAIAILDQK
jgi:glutaminyl-peptide cyclotransferase